MRLTSALVGVLAALSASSALADIRFLFIESAPKDSFRILNEASCATGPFEVIIDLSTSAGRLVFDTTDTGAGVQVFQPFELTTGADQVLSATPVTDGDDMVKLSLASLSPGAEVAFTIDVDDTLRNGELGQIRVAGSEIAGASATVISKNGDAISGVYGRDGRARAALPACL